MQADTFCTLFLHDLVARSAHQHAQRVALVDGAAVLDYASLQARVQAFASALCGLLPSVRGQRVAVWLDHRLALVEACFGTAAAGGVFVPVNAGLKPLQVQHILQDAGAVVLVTTPERLRHLQQQGVPLEGVAVVLTERDAWAWPEAAGPATAPAGPRVDTETAAILYTSGSTGKPKGVVLSHRNLVVGALSVSAYLGNHADDRLLALLPLSFDAGFSQLTTAFAVGAQVVLMNYLLPRDVLQALDRHAITGLTAVPPLYMQLLQAQAATGQGSSLRYFANTGGRMPAATLAALRQRWPQASPVLMYGLTEAFRSTYLPPDEVDRRPGSIGRAIPNAEVLVLREDGHECAVDEPGELVHRGPLVAQGYWGDAARTAERFRPLPAALRPPGLVLPELVVYSGDTVRRDADGYLYFVGRRDEMIKTSGYRVSPTEVEELLFSTGLVDECAAFGVADERLGQAIVVALGGAPERPRPTAQALWAACKPLMPAYMLPQTFWPQPGPLPRNANGKIDRPRLAAEWCASAGATP